MSIKKDFHRIFTAKADNGSKVHIYKRYDIQWSKERFIVVGMNKFAPSWTIGAQHRLAHLGYNYGWNISKTGTNNESLAYWKKREVNYETINALL